jgi:Uma2 family endonuclease
MMSERGFYEEADMNGSTTVEKLRQLPPLENGDRLSREEFERRYEAMPPHIKAELIEGVVYMSSPVRADGHGNQHADIMGWAYFYRALTPGVDLSDNATVRLGPDNEAQPDGVLYILPEHGGQAEVNDGYLEGAPELVIEVAATSVSIDAGTKKMAYQRHGVKEYLIWRVLDDEIDWFILRDSGYAQLAADPAGIVRSETFPGLWLDRPAMLRRDSAAVLRLLQQGLASPEHAHFVASLEAARQP